VNELKSLLNIGKTTVLRILAGFHPTSLDSSHPHLDRIKINNNVQAILHPHLVDIFNGSNTTPDAND